MIYIIFEGYPLQNPTGLLDIFTVFFMFVIYLRWRYSALKLAMAEYFQHDFMVIIPSLLRMAWKFERKLHN